MEGLDKVTSTNTVKEHRRLRQLELPDKWITRGVDSWQGAFRLEVRKKGLRRKNSAATGKRHVLPRASPGDCFIGLLENKTKNGAGRKREETQDTQLELCVVISEECWCHKPCLSPPCTSSCWQLGAATDQLHRGRDRARKLPPRGFEQKPQNCSRQASEHPRSTPSFSLG